MGTKKEQGSGILGFILGCGEGGGGIRGAAHGEVVRLPAASVGSPGLGGGGGRLEVPSILGALGTLVVESVRGGWELF